MRKIEELLQNEGGSYILPFFWQHGEDEETLRDYMRAIDEANIHSVCVECRPHPDFCGPKWWQDMDVILDEAHKRSMKVWILDDDHFPTGHANGGISKADKALRPWYIDSVAVECFGPSPANRFDIHAAVLDKVTPKMFPGMPPQRPGTEKKFFENDEEILSVTAWEINDEGRLTNPQDISSFVQDGTLIWNVPNGSWKIYVTFLTHNGDGRTDYINILDHDSVRVLIDEVYEKHYERYASEFGKTILGFFSDEPMVGNIAGGYQTAKLGGQRHLTNPWQKDLPEMLEERLGKGWKNLMPLLWGEGTDELTIRVRTAYMDAVTRLIEKNFAGQLAAWCEAHDVEYIGHIWEDKHLSYALGGGLGHYFRAMHGNHMGGVDLVFSSQMHPWSQHSTRDSMGGDYYYYTIGKWASSHAHIDPHKKGRALCEIFGATGWDFGVDKMKYLADNFLVSGINRYVPHAFSPKAFPDPDCPPHFYAHGENAQYPSFAKLMEYMQRMCHLLSDGRTAPEVAVLYHAEGDWSSELPSVKNDMYCDVPAKILAEAQIDYDFVPSDLLSSCLNTGAEAAGASGSAREIEKNALTEAPDYPASLSDGKLCVNGYEYKALIVPASDVTSEAVVRFSEAAKKAGFPVFFIDVLPKASAADGFREAEGTLVHTEELITVLKDLGIGELKFSVSSSDLRFLHYRTDSDLYFFVNNNVGTPYEGTVTIPNTEKAWIYDPYDNTVRPAEQSVSGKESRIALRVSNCNPVVLFFGNYEGECRIPAAEKLRVGSAAEDRQILELTDFRLSSCMAKEYPVFKEAVPLPELSDISVLYPDCMDCLRYETEFELPEEASSAILSIDYMSDGAEVFVNGISCGRRIAPEWVYDLSGAIRPGKNTLRIDMAATPARKVAKFYPPEGPVFSMDAPKTIRPEGIIGKVRVIDFLKKR